jgi:outer membrane protein TolC
MLNQLDDTVQAVYLFPLSHLHPTEFDALAEGLIARRIPSFSFFGGQYVERGILAALNPAVFDRLARRVALHAFDILQGLDPSELPITFLPGERLQLNTQTARRIGIFPSWDTIVEAEVIFDLEAPGPVARRLSLESTVREAISANLSILAQDRVVAGGAWEVKRARANLLPQIDVSTTGLIVDQNLAETSFGTQAERSLRASATLTQVLYSEPATANFAVERSLQKARESDRETLMLDVVLDVAIAYLDVLRAKALERIEFENVKLTRSNLELARVREQLGQSGPAEVLRWESQIATNRKNQILASSRRRAAEVVLNQLLNRPLEEPFETIESERPSAEMLDAFTYLAYVDNPQLFGIFRNFMVQEGLGSAPELKAFDAVIAAQERVHAAAKRAYWVPDIALKAGTNADLAKGGSGADGVSLPLPFDLPESNDLHWNIGINLTYPLFSGLDRQAARAAASERLAQLRTERELTRNLVEQRIRTSIELAGGAHGAISQSVRAAEAAGETLRLVTDAYGRGAVSVLDLLDAQNAALVTRTVGATAVYDFLANLMRAHRAIGRFDFLSTEDERRTFEARMDAYFKNAGVDIRAND